MKTALINEENVPESKRVIFNVVLEENNEVVYTMSTLDKEKAEAVKTGWEAGTFKLLRETEVEPGVHVNII